VTCFVGLGVGFAAAGSDKFARLTPLAVLQFVLIIRLAEFLFGFNEWVFPSFSVFQWGQLDVFGQNLWLYILLFIILLILLLLGPFAVMVCLGSRLGALFRQFKPLTAYAINIVGSIAGSILFSVLSFSGAAPYLLLIPAILITAIYLSGKGSLAVRLLSAPMLLAALALSFWLPGTKPYANTYWSPYQKLQVSEFTIPGVSWSLQAARNQGIVIGSNGQFYQYALNLTDENVSNPQLPAQFRNSLKQHAGQYNLPYQLSQPKTVLVLGAGSGNDVASALRHGAEHVDAVDIDPVIIELGRRKHPERPYDSPKVSIYCDDARDFLNKCTSRYDLVVFAGLDSHTVTGRGASVRLDNFVYTRESIRRALQLLNPDGLMMLSFCKSKPWLTQRLFCTIKEAAGYEPIVLLDQSAPELQWEIFLSGPRVGSKALSVPATVAPFAVQAASTQPCSRILTDDWPFIYVTPYEVDVPYLLVVATVLLLSTFAGRRLLFSPQQPLQWQMFFLGAAFILLELQAIARLSLLFGSTWLTSSIVINAVLLMILGANFLVIKFTDRLANKQGLLYAILLATLIISYLLPVQNVLQLPGYAGHAIVSTVTVLPILLAGIIFPVAFAGSSQPERSFAFNLLGAVIGAMLEYLSTYIGINALILVAAVLYACSYVCARKQVAVQDSATLKIS
jgi:SAM-dependent methyltransferase